MQKKTADKVQIVIALGFLIDHQNRCLLCRRNEPGNVLIHDKLEFPGGKVEFGEHPAQTVEREIHEETGITVKVNEMIPYSFVAIRDLGSIQTNPIILCYKCSIISVPDKPHHLPEKITNLEWVIIDKVDLFTLQDGSRFFLKHMFPQYY